MPDSSSPERNQNWLGVIDHASNNPAIREQLRDMVKRETTAAYDAGVDDTERRLAADPPPPNLVDRMRELVQAAGARLVYGTADDMRQAAHQMERIDQLVAEHGDGLRRAIGPALLDAEQHGTGWIRIDVRPVPSEGPGIYDWTFSSPNPTTIVVQP